VFQQSELPIFLRNQSLLSRTKQTSCVADDFPSSTNGAEVKSVEKINLSSVETSKMKHVCSCP